MTTPVRTPSPLGFCVACIRNGARRPATTLVGGNSRCDPHAVEGTDDASNALHKLGVADREAAAGGQLWGR